jgi:nucleoside-diphosphate-sugar epimerase
MYGTDIRIPRIFNTYGPNMDREDGRVVSNFVIQALMGKPLTVYGNGQQTRSFCYVDDLIDGLVRLFFNEKLNIPMNLGNPNPVSMLDLAQEIIALTKSSSQIIFKEMPEDDPKQREPDITLARRILGWEPKVDRLVGIQKTIDYFQDIQNLTI